MFWKPVVSSIAFALLVGCSSNASVICDKVSECGLDVRQRVNGVDVLVDSCEDHVNNTDEDLDECAECVEDRTCAEVARNVCSCGLIVFE